MSCARVYQAMSLGVLLALGCAKEPPLPPALPADRWAYHDDAKGLPTADQINWPPKSVLEPERAARAAAVEEAQRQRVRDGMRLYEQRALGAKGRDQGGGPRKRGKRGPSLASSSSVEKRYAYEPFKVYPVVSAPHHPTVIILPPGERLAAPPVINACAPQAQTDAEGEVPGCWSVGETEMGMEGARQRVIIVRPSKAGMESTMPLLAESGNPYIINLRSQDAKGMLVVTWDVPVPALPSLPSLPVAPARQSPAGFGQLVPVAMRAPSISLDRLYTAYTIAVTSKQRPPWVPAQVFDDGSRTFIRFKEALTFTASPAVFGVHSDRTPAIVEFTPYTAPDGSLTYIVNGLHPLLVLSGVDRMEVTITRKPVDGR